MGSSVRYLGSAAGFAFGVVWMTVGLGSAIVCLLLAALGYCAVFVRERAQANANTRPPDEAPVDEDLHLTPDGFEHDHEQYYEPTYDATTPLTAEADYGWPEEAKQDQAPVTGERVT